MKEEKIELIKVNSFDAKISYYPKAKLASIHPKVNDFFNLKNKDIVRLYKKLHPACKKSSIQELLNYKAKFFYWGGADLLAVSNSAHERKMLLLEMNSCPSGQKSMPILDIHKNDQRGYRELLQKSFLPALKKYTKIKGSLAVLYDKNYMEAQAYAKALANLCQEKVYLIPYHQEDSQVFFQKGILYVEDPLDKSLRQIRAALRYVTQSPWKRFPLNSKTFIYNSPLVCLAGGRNKLLAAKAFEDLNSKTLDQSLKIELPGTIKGLSKAEIPLWFEMLGGKAVVKNPYSNAGQGVYTLTSKKELEDFMKLRFDYDQYILQELIGPLSWDKEKNAEQFYQRGTKKNLQGQSYVCDLRVMVASSPEGFFPVAFYARRAKRPLSLKPPTKHSSWESLGTNLSVKNVKGWRLDTDRLILMDQKEFSQLGFDISDLVQAYIQTVLALKAIDIMTCRLVNSKGKFKHKLFKALNDDRKLHSEFKKEK